MGVELSEADGERIIRLVAAHVGAEVHRGQPLLSAELPETGERFEGILPPAAPGPAFALRKRAIGVIPLERYVIDGMMTSAQAGFLVRAVRERQNILIAGATSSGKTTLGQCAAGRDRRHGRPRAGARRHGGAAMRGPRPRSAAHARRRGVHDRAGALVHAPAA
jgi:Flp pilus assembly CpaF family ATPase